MTTLEQLDQLTIPQDLLDMCDKVEKAMEEKPDRDLDDLARSLVAISLEALAVHGEVEMAKAVTQQLLFLIKLRRQLRQQMEVSHAE